MLKPHFLFKNLPKRTRHYLIIGFSVYIFELIIIFVAQWLGASNLLAVGLSFWLGMLLSFGLQKIVTFQDKRLQHRILIPQLIAYSILVLGNFSFTLFITHLLGGVISPAVSRTLALGITTIWNFYFYKTKVFNRDSPHYTNN
jgi:putative flippase GtrA